MQNYFKRYFFLFLKFFIQYASNEKLIAYVPQGEPVHVVLSLYPRVNKTRTRGIKVGPEILPVHVVKELRDGRHVEDVEVQEVVAVHQLAQHGAARWILVDKEDFLDGGWEDRSDLVEDLLDHRPGLGVAINDQSEARDLLSPRDDGDIILEEKVEVGLKDLVESVSVGEEDERTSCLSDSARQPQHPETNEAFTILQSHVKIVADTRLSRHVALL